MTDRRYTVRTLSAGQRPYGPTERVCQITYEWQGMDGYKDRNAPFVLWDMDNEDGVRRDAKYFNGWTDETEGDWASTRLVYLKKTSPGVWEWKTSAAYDD